MGAISRRTFCFDLMDFYILPSMREVKSKTCSNHGDLSGITGIVFSLGKAQFSYAIIGARAKNSKKYNFLSISIYLLLTN